MTTRPRSLVARGAWTAAALTLVLSALGGTALAGAGPPSVPEIDPGSVLSAVTLLSGGLMVLTDRRRRAR
jgi:hypothetical protein